MTLRISAPNFSCMRLITGSFAARALAPEAVPRGGRALRTVAAKYRVNIIAAAAAHNAKL